MWVATLVAAALVIGQCGETADAQRRLFVVRVDSIQTPPAVGVGDTMKVRFWGVIGNNACYSFSHFEVQRDSLRATVTVWGKHIPAEVCAAVMVELDGRVLPLVPQKKGTLTLNIRQPDGTALTRTVVVQ